MAAVACALLFALLYRSAGERELVLVARRAVPAGRTITADDLAVREVWADAGIGTVPASQRGQVVGQTAAVDLVEGGLLSTAQLGRQRGLAVGDAIVSLALPDAETPSVAPGDRVRLVRTPDPGRGGGEDSVVLGEARVVEVSSDGVGKVAVSLVLDEDLAPSVAGAASAGRVRVLRVPTR